ncbi:MAG: RNA pseudouridine synthase [Spirochaetaceae bacterium]|jgi:23S rRNA pseudouridine1911/1915/1917 synthase|nr:RNA pseudouridine synthase [Spirochaetaceae bacterium]
MVPRVVDENAGYVVLYKPPGLHTAPPGRVRPGRVPEATLLDWCAARFPEVLAVAGKKPAEGGLLHRLDFRTQGLLLLARTQAAMDGLRAQQEAGLFVKEYGALAGAAAALLPGFPAPPENPRTIESAFRPYGPGRRAVRPLPVPSPAAGTGKGKAGGERALDRGEPYRTDLISWETLGDYVYIRARIKRGFRHQIRCHLAWIGRPILNDTLYGGPPGRWASGDGCLALRAQGIFFYDPLTGRPREYRITPLREVFFGG